MVADEYRAGDVVLLAGSLLIAMLLCPGADAISNIGEQFIGFDISVAVSIPDPLESICQVVAKHLTNLQCHKMLEARYYRALNAV